MIRSTITPQVAVKTVAALGIVGAATVSVVVPSAGPAGASVAATAIDASSAQSTPAESALAEARMAAFLGTSRSTERSSLEERVASPVGGASAGVTDTAVTSPAAPAPEVATAVGITGIEAVAKPAAEVNLDKAPAAAASVTTDSVYAAGGYSPTAFLGMCRGLGLGNNAARVCSSVRSLFGPMTIGGYRAGDGGDHGSGQAADIMTSNFAQGDAIAAFLMDNASELNIKYIIWKQRYWAPGGSWRMMSDRGSPTQNHFDHVHVSVK